MAGKGEMFLNGNSSDANETDFGNDRNSTHPEVKSLKDKIVLLEKSLKDKEEIIRLMKNQK